MLRNSILALLLSLPVSFASAQDDDAAIASIQSALRSRHYDQALAAAKSSLKKAPGDFRIWTLQAIALSMQGDNPAALASFHRALTLSPEYLAALKGEAQLLFQTGDKRAPPVLGKIGAPYPQGWPLPSACTRTTASIFLSSSARRGLN
jgi:tetratricopeptide (TPR) repeat protein